MALSLSSKKRQKRLRCAANMNFWSYRSCNSTEKTIMISLVALGSIRVVSEYRKGSLCGWVRVPLCRKHRGER